MKNNTGNHTIITKTNFMRKIYLVLLTLCFAAISNAQIAVTVSGTVTAVPETVTAICAFEIAAKHRVSSTK